MYSSRLLFIETFGSDENKDSNFKTKALDSTYMAEDWSLVFKEPFKQKSRENSALIYTTNFCTEL